MPPPSGDLLVADKTKAKKNTNTPFYRNHDQCIILRDTRRVSSVPRPAAPRVRLAARHLARQEGGINLSLIRFVRTVYTKSTYAQTR
jgi:hypothetical protein